MSKALLICPSARSAVPELSQTTPLAAAPLLGESLVEYWLTHLALAGVKEVRILSDDRPECISNLVANGARWGLTVEVTPEARELTVAQAAIKYAREFPATAPNAITMMDHFPGAPQFPLFNNHAGLFTGLMEWMPKAKTIDRVGMKEVQPGIWIGLHAQVSPEAKLRALLDRSAYLRRRGRSGGSMAVVEDRSFIEAGAEIVNSVIGPETFVGRLATLQKSFACGNTLVNWETESVTQVADAFLLCGLRRPVNGKASEKLLRRLLDLLFVDQRPAVDPLETINEQGRAT